MTNEGEHHDHATLASVAAGISSIARDMARMTKAVEELEEDISGDQGLRLRIRESEVEIRNLRDSSRELWNSHTRLMWFMIGEMAAIIGIVVTLMLQRLTGIH